MRGFTVYGNTVCFYFLYEVKIPDSMRRAVSLLVVCVASCCVSSPSFYLRSPVSLSAQLDYPSLSIPHLTLCLLRLTYLLMTVTDNKASGIVTTLVFIFSPSWGMSAFFEFESLLCGYMSLKVAWTMVVGPPKYSPVQLTTQTTLYSERHSCFSRLY